MFCPFSFVPIYALTVEELKEMCKWIFSSLEDIHACKNQAVFFHHHPWQHPLASTSLREIELPGRRHRSERTLVANVTNHQAGGERSEPDQREKKKRKGSEGEEPTAPKP